MPNLGRHLIDKTRLDRELAELGWSRADLATKSKLSKRTIDRVFTSGSATNHVFGAIYGALRAEYARKKSNDEMPNDQFPVIDQCDDQSSSIVTAADTQSIELTIDEDFDLYTEDQQEKLLRAIRNLLETEKNIRITRKSRGSVKITLQLPPIEAEKLLWAVKAGELSAFSVIDAIFVDECSDHIATRHAPGLETPSTHASQFVSTDQSEVVQDRDRRLTSVVNRYGPWILKRARQIQRRYKLQPIDAEDISQRVLLKLWRRLKQPFPYENGQFRCYVEQALKTEAISVLRTNRKLPNPHNQGIFDHMEVEAGSLDALVAQDFFDMAMARLDPRSAELLRMKFQQSLTNKEIAMRIGASDRAVGMRLCRAKSKLKKLLKDPTGAKPNE